MNPKVGILGGGQLSLMLASAARRMGLETLIFAEDSDAPAAQVFAKSVLGLSKDLTTLRRFFSRIDLAVFENEFVDCELLEKAASGLGTQFLPGLKTIQQVQDKLTQKRI